MRKILFLLLVLVFLGGCLPINTDQGVVVELVSGEGAMYRPQVSGVDDWYVQPGNLEWLDWNPGRDSLGNPTGVTEGWHVTEVHIRCELKNVDDTVFPTEDPDFWYWVPGWTGEIDATTGWPHSPYPGIPNTIFDSCETHTVFEDGAPEQTAHIVAVAHRDQIAVRITCPDKGSGWFVIDQIPGYTPTSENVLTIRVGQSGNYTVTWSDGNDTETWDFLIPEDWFWMQWEGDIPVGPIGACQ